MYWNKNTREYILGTNIKSFHTWLLNSTHSQTYQYMLENDVSFKTAKNHFKPVRTNNDKAEKMMKMYNDMMEKENKACVARLNASKKLLSMTSMESM
jgi:ribonucleotide reductase beta subunit family protein with ferritin-like domain